MTDSDRLGALGIRLVAGYARRPEAHQQITMGHTVNGVASHDVAPLIDRVACDNSFACSERSLQDIHRILI